MIKTKYCPKCKSSVNVTDILTNLWFEIISTEKTDITNKIIPDFIKKLRALLGLYLNIFS